MGLEQEIFNRFFSIFDKRNDTNQDANGEGTWERYNKVIGWDVDTNIYPKLDDLIQNLFYPNDERFIQAREAHLGNNTNAFLLASDTAMRKRVIRLWMAIIRQKGTKQLLETLLSWLGITATITELFDTGGFDSATTLDSETRPTFDSGKCAPCTFYTVDLVGPILVTELLQGLLYAIEFNEPINARLFGLTYNGLDLLNLTFAFNYKTNQVGLHTPSIIGGGQTLWQFGTSLTDVRAGESVSYNYTQTATKTVRLNVQTPSAVSELRFNSLGMESFVASIFTNCTYYDFGNNPSLLTLSLPASNVNNIDKFDVSNTALTTLNLVNFTNLGGVFNVRNNLQLTTITLSPLKSSYETILIDMRSLGTASTINLEHFLMANGSQFLLDASPLTTTLTAGTTIQTNDISLVSFSGCSSLKSSNLSAWRGQIEQLIGNNCIALKTLNVGTGFTRPDVCNDFQLSNIVVTGDLDIQSLPIGLNFVINTHTLDRVLHDAVGNTIATYRVINSTTLIYYSITNLTGLIAIDNGVVDLSDNALLDTEVDSFLADMVTIVTGRGEVIGGDYTGRTFIVDGTNAAPTAAGLASIATLNTYGITVQNN